MSERQTKAGNLQNLPNFALSHSLTLAMLNNFCFHVYAQKSLSHSHSLTLSHSHTLQSLIHSLSTSTLNIIITLSCEFRVHRAGSQLKIIDWDETIDDSMMLHFLALKIIVGHFFNAL